jgi:hypothetical protein
VDPDSLNPDMDIRTHGFDDQKLKKKIQMKKLFIFFDKKIAIYLSLSHRIVKDVPAIGKAFSPQKRTSSTWKN